MQTPDPNNPQPGDRFTSPNGVEWEIRAVDRHAEHGDAAWLLNPVNGRSLVALDAIATWTPVTPTPPDVFVLFDVDGDPWGLRNNAQDADIFLRSHPGFAASRYTFAERVDL